MWHNDKKEINMSSFNVYAETSEKRCVVRQALSTKVDYTIVLPQRLFT